jgi:hypothetical protein
MKTITRLALLAMENANVQMRFITAASERANSLGGWQCDYGAEINHWQEIYNSAKTQVEEDIIGVEEPKETPCTHAHETHTARRLPDC